MSLIKWDKEDIFPSFFDDFFGPGVLNTMARGTTMPAVNISENDKNFMVEVAAPGLRKEDFKISLDNHMLTISAEHKEEKPVSGTQQPVKGEQEKSSSDVEKKNNGNRFTRREFSFTSFRRTFTLPDAVIEDQIEARYENGILEVVLPKRQETYHQHKKMISIK